MQKIRFCLIGTGRAGRVHLQNLARRIPTAELVALCDANAETLATAGREYPGTKLFADYREAVASPEIDAVVIVTPTFLHCQIACAAAEHGKHVFLEKPMAVSVDECRAINDAVRRAGVKLQLGFMRRFDEGFLKAKEILESGELGRVMVIKSTGRGPGLPPPWIFDVSRSNGIIAEVNSHDLDSLNWFVGKDVERVYAEAVNVKCDQARKDHPEFYDNVVSTFRFVDGTLGVVDGTCPADYGYDARVEILCAKGVLFLGHVTDSGATKVTVDGRVVSQAVKSWRTLFKDAYLAEMEHFIQSICEDATPRVTGEDGLRAVSLAVAVNQSLRNRTPVQPEGKEKA
jgi:myo-inositol 2-dehydrogenase/D-chiro-inositol 1-dehydrogenase/scyllo-inositol 2-dehydrogenase (NAD+)